MSEAIKLLSLKDLKACMGISEATILRHLGKKHPPFNKAIKIGRRVFISVNAYNDWVLSNESSINNISNG